MVSSTGSAGRVSAAVLFAVSTLALALGQENPPNQPQPSPARPVITLAVAVTDKDHHPVADLRAEDFAVYEDDQPQQITCVERSPVPACLGLVVDNSGSMREQRAAMIQALMKLVEAGNPGDRVFVVNFNDEAFLDQDFTTNHGLIEASLIRPAPRGGTALYDAVIASADHLAQTSACQNRVMVVMTDGDDNSSQKSLVQTIDAVRYARSPVIYGIVMVPERPPSRKPADHHAVEQLTAATGGAVFSTGNIRDVDKLAMKVAAEIQNQYTITYSPANSPSNGNFHRVRVEVHPQDRKNLNVRFREGYVAGPIPRAPAAHVADVKPPADRGCMFGTVIDAEGKPVPRMIVHAVPPDHGNPPFPFGRTDRDGAFRIDGVRPGSYLISTENRGEGYPPTALSLYRNARLPAITVNTGTDCANIAITLGPKAARLRLNVVDAGTHQEIFRFVLTVQRADDPNNVFPIAGNGDRAILLPPATNVTIWVQADGYEKSAPMSMTTSSSGVSAELTVELKPKTN
jgi:Ca-activated chloride channel homolog